MQSGGLMTSGHSGETSTEGELFTNLFWYFPNRAPTYLSRGTVASIHPEVRACHERAPLRQEEHGRGLEILGRPEPPEECTGHPDLLQFGVCGQECVCHGRSYVPWGQGVHPDAVLAPLLRYGPAQLLYCGFAAVIRGACQSLEGRASAFVEIQSG